VPILRVWISVCVAACVLAIGAPLAAESARDDQIRATFLLLLTKYVTWPDDAFASPTAPIVVAVVGNPGLASTLQTLSTDQRVAGRAFEIRAVPDAAASIGAHLVFVAEDQSEAVVAGSPLRITEEPDKLSRTDIAIRLEGDRVAFSVNRKDVARRGLKLSSKLLKLASSFE
jgi:YfiR/HmsC-like